MECRRLKRNNTKLAKAYAKCPLNDATRNGYYQLRKQYRNHIKRKKEEYIYQLNRDIEDDNNIRWDKYKKLKWNSADEDKLDLYDLANFYKFFQDLYSNKKSVRK